MCLGGLARDTRIITQVNEPQTMASLRDLKKKWKELAAQLPDPYWFELFDEMLNHLSDNSPIKNDLYNLKRSLRKITADEQRFIISYHEAFLAYNKIGRGLLKIIDEITGNSSINGAQKHDIGLDEQLLKLHLKRPLMPLHLVNCDRRQNNKLFNKTQVSWKDSQMKAQFYFALGCPTQKPDGFAERLVFEISEKRSLYFNDHIDFPRIEQRVSFKEFPKGNDLKEFQKGFLLYLEDRFDFKGNTVEKFFVDYLTKSKTNVLIFPFEINLNLWDEGPVQEYLDWLINKINSNFVKGPTCVFIFTLQLDNAHLLDNLEEEEYRNIELIKGLRVKNSNNSCLFYPFNPVHVKYLEHWIRDLFRDISTKEIYDLLYSYFSHKTPLSPTQNEFMSSEIDMEYIQDFQLYVWQLHQ